MFVSVPIPRVINHKGFRQFFFSSTRQQRVYRGPFISEDRNVDLSTALFHVTMYRQFARKVGTSANSAIIRYYLPRLKLSSSTLALARERTPSYLKFNVDGLEGHLIPLCMLVSRAENDS